MQNGPPAAYAISRIAEKLTASTSNADVFEKVSISWIIGIQRLFISIAFNAKKWECLF